MIINKNLENSKSGSERLISRILKKKQASSTHIIALSLVSIVCFSGCATVGQKIAGAADAYFGLTAKKLWSTGIEFLRKYNS